MSEEKKLNGTIIVTYRCNARCSMCNRYKAPSKPEEEISIETIKKLPKMYFTNITGGEPFIRTDLKDIVRELYKKSDRIVISTNGFFFLYYTFLKILRADCLVIPLCSKKASRFCKQNHTSHFFQRNSRAPHIRSVCFHQTFDSICLRFAAAQQNSIHQSLFSHKSIYFAHFSCCQVSYLKMWFNCTHVISHFHLHKATIIFLFPFSVFIYICDKTPISHQLTPSPFYASHSLMYMKKQNFHS